jgi:hypothetical protein
MVREWWYLRKGASLSNDRIPERLRLPAEKSAKAALIETGVLALIIAFLALLNVGTAWLIHLGMAWAAILFMLASLGAATLLTARMIRRRREKKRISH